MLSIYPSNQVQKVLEQLEAVDVLEFLDWHPESFQLGKGTLRAYCPVHKEENTRTLVVDRAKKHCYCSRLSCALSEGGDLIQLFAMSQKMAYDDALRLLVDEFSIDIKLAEEPEEIYRRVVEAENRLQLSRVEPDKRQQHLREARQRLDMVLAQDPNNLRVLRAQVRYLREAQETTALLPWILKQSIAEDESKNFEFCEKLLRSTLEKDPNNRQILWRLVDHYRQRGFRDQALELLMKLADLSEMEADYQGAIEAYRAVDALAHHEIDVTPMISQLLVLLDNNVEAAREMVRQADRAREENRLAESRQIIQDALELDPNSEEAILSLIKTQGAMGISRKEFSSALRHVDKLMERGKWDVFIQLLTAMDEIHPGDSNIVERLVIGYTQTGNLPKARELRFKALELYQIENDLDACLMMLDEMLQEDPKDKEALRRVAKILADKGDVETAISRLRTLVQLLEREQDYDEAIAVYRRMVELAPDSARIALAFSGLLIRLERKKLAIEVLSKSLEVLQAESNMSGLRQVAEQALILAPEKPEFLLAYAHSLEALGESVKAGIQRVKACRHFLERGKPEEARAELERLLTRDPANTKARQELVHVLEKLNLPVESAAQARELATLFYRQGEYLDCLQVLENLRERNVATEADLERLIQVTQILRKPAEQTRARLQLAALHAEAEQWESALNQVAILLETEPHNEEFQRLRLEYLESSGNLALWSEALWRLCLLCQEQENITAERDLLQRLLTRCPNDLPARDRFLEILLLGNTPTEQLTRELTEYVRLTLEAGLAPHALEKLTALQGLYPKSTPIAKALVSLHEATRDTTAEVARLKSLVQLLQDQGNHEEVIIRLTKLRELTPSEEEVYRQLAAAHGALNQTDEAVAVLLDLATMFQRNHRFQEAEQTFEELFTLDPEHEDVFLGLAEYYRALGGHEKQAVQNIREAALLASRRGDIARGIELLQQALAQSPHSLFLRRELANLHLDAENRNVESALEELALLAEEYRERQETDAYLGVRREMIQLAPERGSLRRTLIDHLVTTHQPERAVAELVDYGRFLLDQGDADQVDALCREALELEADSIPALSLQAELLQRKGRKEEALAAWAALSPRIQKAAKSNETASAPRTKTPTGFTPLPLAPRSTPPSAFSTSYARGASGLAINPMYDFDRLIVGEHNRFAVAAARAIAKSPGETPHNPLFLYSDVGMGKTHLLQAIANQVQSNARSANAALPRIVYSNSEQFTAELVDAIQENALQQFREHYRTCDMMLIDDIHFLAGKELAQEEFFHLFNYLYQAKKQIVVTSDRPPREISHLEKRLKSRFGAGVIVEIKAPNYETRLAILQRQLKETPHLTVGDGLMKQLAETVSSSIRELKGALAQFVARHEIGGDPLNTETLSTVLEMYLHNAPERS
ncbi:MAG: DnaA/Hda family protein [Candidatus Sumerlaeia bacterium]|nr:DnaA/Hda family protein [Candidatus Sumerlaeia bacterium]